MQVWFEKLLKRNSISDPNYQREKENANYNEWFTNLDDSLLERISR
jgi:hypothetical protein